MLTKISIRRIMSFARPAEAEAGESEVHMQTIPENGVAVKKFDAETPKEMLDGIADAEELELIAKIRPLCAFEACSGRKSIWMQAANGEWTARPAQDAIEDIANQLGESDEKKVRRIIDDYCAVDVVWRDGLLLPAGIHDTPDGRWLVRRGMPFWREGHPERMKNEKLREKIRLSNTYINYFSLKLESAQADMLDMFLGGYRLMQKEFARTYTVSKSLPLLALVGAQGSGKTLMLKRLFPNIFGTRGLDYARCAAGKTQFTGHVESHAFLTIDDSNIELSTPERQAMAKTIKKDLYGSGREIHLKGHDAITLKLPQAEILAANTDAASLRALPLLIGKDSEKMLVMEVKNCALPKNETDAEKADWNAKFDDEQQIQDYIDYIEWFASTRNKANYKPYDERQYVKGGCPNEGLKKLIDELSPQNALEVALRSAVREIQNREDDGKPVTLNTARMRRCDALDAIQRYALPVYRREFNSSCRSDKARKEAFDRWIEVLGEGKTDAHSKCTVWDFSQLIEEEEDAEGA